jgi:uncharacterized protein with HEPN domain
MNKDDRIRLLHMLEAAQEAVDFARHETRESLRSDRRLALALIKDIEIIGEAASRISKDFQTSHSQIPWSVIIAMRNRLIHAYFEIDFDQVWDTVHGDLPVLVTQLQTLLSSGDDV